MFVVAVRGFYSFTIRRYYFLDQFSFEDRKASAMFWMTLQQTEIIWQTHELYNYCNYSIIYSLTAFVHGGPGAAARMCRSSEHFM